MMQAQNAETKAIVTGGAQGIGFAIANQLVVEGCKSIALIGRDKDKSAKAVAKLEGAGAQVIFISADISDEKRRPCLSQQPHPRERGVARLDGH